MNTARIAVGAASLLGALIVATLTTRWYARPLRARGRHRARRIVVWVSLRELLDGQAARSVQ